MGSLQQIGGAKGSSESQKSPTETPDSLISIAYAKVLDAISEGPILGLANGFQSIFLNNTPLANADGSLNFTGVTVGTRTGEADQDYIPGFPSVESETGVGVELKFGAPWIQTISNTELSAVRIRLAVPYLTHTDEKGNINGYEVDYAIDVATDSGPYVTVFDTSFNGKTTSTYERSHRIDLPKSTSGWRLRVRRLTPDSTSSTIQSTTNISSYTEIIDAKLRYPYTAMIGLTVDAAQFSSIPSRAFDCKLRIVRVPSNYTPETRAYSGTWDGTFKLAWTDNPAWIYYDLILNDRYGLGQLITAAQVDKWGLYQIAGYCDQMVSDGKGGTEPRFTCNLYLQTRADALQVLQDIASIFRGMAYWAAGSVVASADMPSDPVYTYTNANVIDGLFTYVGSSRSTRFSVALVSWNDPTNFYEKKVEYVSDQKALARYGVQQTELSAFGCTSQGQAQRLGHYTLLTNLLENETVSFAAGLDGTIARPGQIIRIADADRAGRRIGGRIKAATARTITLDADATVAVGDSVTVILPTGVAQTKTVTGYADRVVRVGTSWTSIPVAQSVFAIESNTLAAQTFRVLSVAENFSDTEMKYDITAVKHVPGKYAAIDNGAQIVQLPVTVIPASVQAPPTNIRLSSFTAIDQGIATTTMRAEWDAPVNSVSYDVWWRRNSNDWVYAGRTYSASIEVAGVYAGTYLVRVAALNALNAASLWAYSESTDLAGKVGLPPAVTSLTTESLIFGIGLKWTFPPGAEDTQRTEIWYGEAPDLAKAIKLADLAFPQSDYTMMGLRAGQTFFFWARLIDRSGNVGPWYPTAPTVINGQASADAGDILEYLTGKITQSELGKELLSEIGKIGGEGPGSVNERVDQVRDELQQATDGLGQRITEVNNTVTEVKNELQEQIDQIGDLADSMPYKPGDPYTAGQGTLGDDGIIYQAIKAVPINTPPPNTEFWLNVGQAVQTANGLAARVNTAETKITSIEGVNTSQATQISGLQTSLTGKADSSVVSSLSSRVTTAENSISSQGTAITGLQNTVAGKADASTVQALSNKVTQQGTDLTAAGSAITSINANLASVGGENLYYNPSFDKPWPTNPSLVADGWSIVGNATNLVTSLVASTLDTAGKAQRTNLTLADGNAYADVGANVDVEPKVAPGTIVTASGHFRSTVGILAQIYIQYRNAAGQIISTDGPTTADGTDAWKRLSRTATAPAPAGTVSVRVLFRTRGPSNGSAISGFSEWDRMQLEISPVMSGWKDNGKVNASDINASAVATSALSGRVTQTETTLTSVSGQLVTLNNSLGSAGGDNLLGNSSFELPSPIDATRPQYWRGDMGDGALPVFAWVDSPLPSSTKAIRVSKPSLIANGYIGPTFAPEDGPRPKVVPGTSYTLSAYVRLSGSGARFAMYMVFVNEAGTVVTAPQLAETAVGTSFTRLSMTAVAPVGATRLQVYPGRLLNRSGAAATDMWMELDNVQLQEGTVPTAYSPSVQGVETQLSATSNAVSSLQSTVTQQGQSLTSNSADIVSLKNSIGSASPFVAGIAWEFLSNNRNWYATSNGGSPVGTFTAGPAYSTLTGLANLQATDSFGKANGTENPFVRFRFRRKNTTRTTGSMYWANEDGGLAEARRMNFPITGSEDWQDVELNLSSHAQWNGKTGIFAIRLDLENNTDTTAIIDIAYIALGRRAAAASAQALDALTNRVTSAEGVVTSIAARTTSLESSVNSTTNGLATKASASALDSLTTRVSTVEGTTTSSASRITSLESTVNNGSTGLATKASSAALNSLQTTVTSQGNTITSQASQINNLNSVVGNQGAALQTQAQAIADSNGKISAAYSVRLNLAQNGLQYVAGFGISLDNNAGTTQSQFVVAADRFAVIRDVAGNVTSPFIIEGGQVFMSDAVIKKATITEAVVGSYLRSAAKASNGAEIMTLDMVAGQVITRNNAGNGYCQVNSEGIFGVVNNVVMFELRV